MTYQTRLLTRPRDSKKKRKWPYGRGVRGWTENPDEVDDAPAESVSDAWITRKGDGERLLGASTEVGAERKTVEVDLVKAVNLADDKNRRDGDGLMRLREAGCDGEGRRGVGRESGQSREKFFSGTWKSSRGDRSGWEMTKVAGNQNKRGRAWETEVRELGMEREKRRREK